MYQTRRPSGDMSSAWASRGSYNHKRGNRMKKEEAKVGDAVTKELEKLRMKL